VIQPLYCVKCPSMACDRDPGPKMSGPGGSVMRDRTNGRNSTVPDPQTNSPNAVMAHSKLYTKSMKPHMNSNCWTCGASSTPSFTGTYYRSIGWDTHPSNYQFHTTHRLHWTMTERRCTMSKPSLTHGELGRLKEEWNTW